MNVSPVIQNQLSTLTIEEKVAQCMMVGFSGTDIHDENNQIFRQFLEFGVGGIIFFDGNCRPLNSQKDIQELISAIHKKTPSHLPDTFIAIDQEGGPVERLPHTYFPTGVSPYAISKSHHPEKVAQQQYKTIATQLRSLGFTMNFFPTLDVNLNPDNPIIGIRSFGENSKDVWKLAKIAIEEQEKARILSVGKHFPGHGNGTVDSHKSLPTLKYTDEEFSVFKNAIKNNIPAMMISHGFYPDLQNIPKEKNCPASLSKTIIHDLLIKKENYQGLIISDDMTMGAALQHTSPEEAAITGFNAGLDILIYNQSTKVEWQVFNALIDAVKSNIIPQEKLDRSVTKILSTKQNITAPEKNNISQDTESASFSIAREAISVLKDYNLPLDTSASILVVHPDRSKIHHYEFDARTSPDFPGLLTSNGIKNIHAYCYNPFDSVISFDDDPSPDIFIWLDYHSHRYPEQENFYLNFIKKHPQTKKIIVFLGIPNESLINHFDTHILLANYRPASMHALAGYLSSNNPV